MFMWLNVLLSVLAFPFVFLCGKPVRVTSVQKCFGEDLKEFPASSKTPIVEFVARRWFAAAQRKLGTAANAFFCFVIYRPEYINVIGIRKHESVHVLQQSVISPIVVALIYVADLIMYIAFRKRFNREKDMLRFSVVEKVAYRMDGRGKE